MAQQEFDIRYVANLARIQLSPEEQETLGAQMNDILGYVQKLQELDVSQVDPTAHAMPVTNVTQPDEPAETMSHENALRNAPSTSNGLFLVPKIVE